MSSLSQLAVLQGAGKFPTARLEDWYRENYFTTQIDISGSGVQDYTFHEVRQLAEISHEELDSLVMRDSKTLGSVDLRQSIANRYASGDAGRIMVTNGSSEAIFDVMQALLTTGDEVVIMDPFYHSYVSVAQVLGCRISSWALQFEDDFEPSLQALERLLTPRTRMVIVNLPHNPTGTALTRAAQWALVQRVAACGAYLVWDAAFADLIYEEDHRLIDCSQLYERVIVINTFSKAYGLPGLRVGWCVAPPEVLEECIRIRDFTVLFMSSLVEHIAVKVIDNAERFIGPRFEQAKRNLAVVERWLQQHANRLQHVRPKGGVTVFAALPGVRDVDAFCTELIAARSVLLCPGSCFGRPQFVRIGFGGSSADLQVGLERLSVHMDECGI